MSYCPRSSLPVAVLGWLARRLAQLAPPRPPGQAGNRPLALEVRLDAVAAVVLDGLSYRRAGRVVGISKTEVGDSMDLLLPRLATLGYRQPDGTFITSLDDLRQWLAEMAASGEAVVVDGLATRVQRPAGWANQRVLYDAKRHAHTAQGLAVSTVWGDLPAGQCLGAAPLARAAGADTGIPPGCGRTGPPRPLAPSRPTTKSITDTLIGPHRCLPDLRNRGARRPPWPEDCSAMPWHLRWWRPAPAAMCAWQARWAATRAGSLAAGPPNDRRADQ